MVSERPILFSGRMVRAILAGRKTQTRRVVNPQPPKDAALVRLHPVDDTVPELAGKVTWFIPEAGDLWPCNREDAIACRYGQPGDRLWVREAFRLRADQDSKPPSQDWWKSGAWYEADGTSAQPSGCAGGAGKLRPSIHMPRWASRITLDVTGVRIERLQDITPEDAKAEGVDVQECACDVCRMTSTICTADQGVYIETFRELWDSVNGKREGCSWGDNPWLWVVEFPKWEATS
jgi:hypothetical protein